ncbi:VanZ family protein [Desulfomarina sp.]
MKVSGADTVRMVPALIVMGTIFFLSHQPGDTLYMPPLPWFDKIAHLAIYALLAISVLYGFFPLLKEKKFPAVTLSVVIFCVFYGISDEFHQSFIPGRFVSIGDVAADGAGALLACCGWFLWQTFLRR